MGIRSVNLTVRNEKIYEREFNSRGRNGKFSKWINGRMNQEFTLSPAESIRQQEQKNMKEIERLKEDNDKLGVKLASVLARTNNV